MTDTRIDQVELVDEQPMSPIGVRVWACLGLAVTSWLIVLTGAWLIVAVASAVIATPGASALPPHPM